MSKYNTILFDADGTLFDFDKAETFALQSALNELNLPYSDTILKEYKQINASLWVLLEQGKTTQGQLRNKRFEMLHERFGFGGDSKKTCEVFIKYLSQAFFFLDGATQILEDLYKHYDLYLVTNGITDVQKSRYALSGMDKYFGAMFISEEVGVSKPDIRYFEHVFAAIGMKDTGKVLIVGDSLTSDIKGGNNAGIAACWYNPTGVTNATDSVCDFEIAQLSELNEIVSQL